MLAHVLFQGLFEKVDEFLGGDYTIYLYGSELEEIPFHALISKEVRNGKDLYKSLIQADWLIDRYNFKNLSRK